MKLILTALIIKLTITLSFCQSSFKEQIRWGNKNLTLIIVNDIPKEGDTIVGMKPFRLMYLNQQVVGLLKYRTIADSTIKQQDLQVQDLLTISGKKDKQIENLETMNKNTKRTWLKRSIGISVGCVSLGLGIGLLLPIILD